MHLILCVILFNSLIIAMHGSRQISKEEKSKYCITFRDPYCACDKEKEIKNDGEVYTSIYPFTKERGLVKVISKQILNGANLPPDYNNPYKSHGLNQYEKEKLSRELCALIANNVEQLKKLGLIVKRHDKKHVLLRAAISDVKVKIYENKDSHLLWIPWEDDVITDTSNTLVKGYRTVRDGNKLCVDLKTPGRYELTLPLDTELEVNLACGDVTYEVKNEKTIILAKSIATNKIGAGPDDFSIQNMDCKYIINEADDSAPLTSISTKGHFELKE